MIGVINPDSGNITSVGDMLTRLNRDYKIMRVPQDLEGVGQILLPGQGRFGAVMDYLNNNGWVPVLQDWAAADKPLLCICVGMQVLFNSSEEDPEAKGLGVFKGRITELNAPKRPMMGWARVHFKDPSRNGAAYFVNGYGLKDHPLSVATTTYGETFCVAVSQGNIHAFQFHPEKSGIWGKELLNTCLIT